VTARYAEFAPRADLAGHVACVWVFEGEDADDDQRIAPDGRCELIVHHGEPYLERDVDGALARQPPVLFAGQLTRPLHIRARGRVGVTGVRFTEAGAYAYLGRPLDAFTDRRTALDVAGLGGADEASRLAVIQDHVAAVIARLAVPPDPVVAACVARLLSTPPKVRTAKTKLRTGKRLGFMSTRTNTAGREPGRHLQCLA
jgi:hypothetical protein